jgi:hypothetical protein
MFVPAAGRLTGVAKGGWPRSLALCFVSPRLRQGNVDDLHGLMYLMTM